ncbi:MAG: hypothetical protein ACK41V_18335 [Acidovorax sp.]|uniref:hypothetical protein n=1 Tax=Acidovorax sp. TaxID=1872122 RepID=UPI00391CE21E
MPFPLRPLIAATLVVSLMPLLGCSKPETSGPAQAGFDALVTSCTQFLADRAPHVRPGGSGEWTKTGYSPALLKPELSRTESPVTPYVGKIVVKDNEAQATATTQAAAEAVTLTPAHLLSNRTHTFVYSFDGKTWRWQNGQLLTKIPGHNDTTVALTLADVSAMGPKGFIGCLPR